jgi:hypothetical protein
MVFHWNSLGSIRHAIHPKPVIAFLSGTHGNEHEVIPILEETLTHFASKLPPFVYIPIVSPSAVKQKTRRNKNNNDMNRIYNDQSEDEEMQELTKILSPHSFTYVFDFHEDPEYDSFYLYDTGNISQTIWSKFSDKMQSIGVRLFTGYDDPHDPVLNQYISNGYIGAPDSNTSPSSGTAWDYMYEKGICERMLTIEVPGPISLQAKKNVIETVFTALIFPLLAKDQNAH